MANISDAYGTITVERAGQDLVYFLKVVQEKAYYILIDDVDNLTADSDGYVEFTFGAGGRWSYNTNIQGYLLGDWMNGEKEKEAYDKFIKAFKEKKGLLVIEYSDSDVAMNWMGKGFFQMGVDDDGEIEFSDNFEEEEVTIKALAEANGEDTYWALEYIYGEEVSEKYDEYAEKCEKEGKEPATPEVWFESIYEEEE